MSAAFHILFNSYQKITPKYKVKSLAIVITNAIRSAYVDTEFLLISSLPFLFFWHRRIHIITWYNVNTVVKFVSIVAITSLALSLVTQNSKIYGTHQPVTPLSCHIRIMWQSLLEYPICFRTWTWFRPSSPDCKCGLQNRMLSFWGQWIRSKQLYNLPDNVLRVCFCCVGIAAQQQSLCLPDWFVDLNLKNSTFNAFLTLPFWWLVWCQYPYLRQDCTL